jgi:hypothetical protein
MEETNTVSIAQEIIYRNYSSALFSLLKFLKFSQLSPLHHIKYAKRHMFGVLNIGKKVTNCTVLMHLTTQIFLSLVRPW